MLPIVTQEQSTLCFAEIFQDVHSWRKKMIHYIKDENPEINSAIIEAAQNRNSTYFINCNDLIANLKKAQSENRFINRLNHYARYKVLIIDEVGFLPMDLDGANMLFQLINKRYEKHSTIITTNKPFGKWHEIFNDVTLANAILDRLLHHSHIININGNSYRLKDKLKIDSDVSEPMHN